MQTNGGRRFVVAAQTRGADGAAPSRSQHIMTTHLVNTTLGIPVDVPDCKKTLYPVRGRRV